MKQKSSLPGNRKVTHFSCLTQTAFRKLSVAMLISICMLSGFQSKAQLTYGLSGNHLISFDATTPTILLSTVPITGITSGQAIEGMDFRPLTGQLYAFGYNKMTMNYQLYTINLLTGTATAVNSPGILNLGLAAEDKKLQIGFDFNPTVDRIRVVSTKDFNYRLNPNDGSISFTDLKLNYAIGDVAAGTNPSIATVGYTNSYAGATSTTLYDVDYRMSTLSTQNPPNNGTLITVGSLGIEISKGDPTLDMDVYFDPSTLTNKAYLSANVKMDKKDMLYSLNLATGLVTALGYIGGGIPVSDLAVFIDRTLTPVTGNLIFAITTNNNLISFDSDKPSYVRTQVAVTGITTGQSIVGADFRPATGELFALGYNNTTGESQLYKVNTSSGVTTIVNTTPTILSLGGTMVGLDFNPTVDKIRVVSANNMNYRLDPLTGAITFTDLNLNYGAGDINFGADPNVNAVAYTNSFAGSVTTTLYDYDFILNFLSTQNPPNNGTLLSIGASGIMVNTVDPSIDMDIYSEMAGNTNIAFLAANTGSSINDVLYTVDVATGTVTSLGMIGYGVAVKNIAVTLGNGMKAAGNSIPSSIKVYPNPVNELLHIQLEVTGALTIEVKDINGKSTGIMFNENADGLFQQDLNLSSLSPGIYFVSVIADGKVMTQRIVKQ
ncbi:MAG: DUF4394 domain-containing protein [Chitinophagales bacterium]|nr:DUF4394 domain-containing protein [Chitinophagales bacterium]